MTALMVESSSAEARKIHVTQGGHFVTADPAAVLTTVLGSCVAACLRDPYAGVGGMNHFLLADGERGCGEVEAMRYGAYLMEVLINGLLAQGAARGRIEAKLFGGARMFEGLSDVGASNARFARRFLADEGIALAGESLGGCQARRVEFWPVSGRVRQRYVAPALLERNVVAPVPPPEAVGDVELF